jgi:signal transduction histidine kinase
LVRSLADISISKKVASSFASIFVCLGIVALTAYAGFREVSANQQAIYERDMPASILLTNLSYNIHRLGAVGQLLVMGQDPTVKDKQIEEIFTMQEQNQAIFAQLKQFFANDRVVLDSVSDLESEISPAYGIANKELEASLSKDYTDEERIALVKEQRKKLKGLMKLADEVKGLPQEFAKRRMEATRLRIHSQVMLFGVVAGVIVLLTALQMYMLSVHLLKPLSRLSDAAKAIEGGDLSTDFFAGTQKRGDELGILQDSFEAMQIGLRNRTDELNKAIISLNESNSELQHFAYIAAHDLQEPLRTIVSYLGLLEKRLGPSLDEKGRKYINNSVSGAERMRSLIKGLLDIARITTKAKPAEQVACDQVIEQIRQDLRVFLSERNARIKSAPLPVVLADSTQLTQVFQNLIQNAIKFQGEAPPVVTITCKSDGDKWLFAVADNGIGMNMEYADRIFAVFQRLHTATEYAGTGIGLSVCKKIVERHGGKIWVESEEGKGSTFYFTIVKGREAKAESARSKVITGSREIVP